MAFDTHSIFGNSSINTILSQISPTLVVTLPTGDGVKFAINQQVVICAANAQPSLANAMICRITAIATDQLTIDYSSGNREGSNTRTVLAGDQIFNAVTTKPFTDLEAAVKEGWCITVAPSSASAAVKNKADYVCTGTNDQTIINSAIAALGSSGGWVMLLPGIFNITGQIVITYNYTKLSGCGWATQLNILNSTNTDIIKFNPGGGAYCIGSEISDMYINLNGANQTSGDGIMGEGIVWCTFRRLWIYAPWGNGLKLNTDNLGSFGHHNNVVQCFFQKGNLTNGGDGRAILLNQSDENMVIGNVFQDNGRAAASEPNHVFDKSGLNTFMGNQFVGGPTGLKFNTTHSKAIGNTFDGCHDHNIRVNGDKCQIEGNWFFNIGFSATANTIDGIWVDNVAETIITGNHFLPPTSSNGCRSGVNLSSGPATKAIVEDNDFSVLGGGSYGTSTIIPGTGAGHKINNNLGVTTISTKTSNYTLTPVDKLILGNGTLTATLPTAVGNDGLTFIIKRIHATNTTTVGTTSSQTIDGSTTQSLSSQYASITVMSDGAGWQIIAKV